jgi:hypothetical protein
MHVTHEELRRLTDLTQELRTLSDVLAAFGPPDWDRPAGTGVTKEDETGRPTTTYFRTLTYRGLSATANVDVTVQVDDRVGFNFKPKDKTGM